MVSNKPDEAASPELEISDSPENTENKAAIAADPEDTQRLHNTAEDNIATENTENPENPNLEALSLKEHVEISVKAYVGQTASFTVGIGLLIFIVSAGYAVCLQDYAEQLCWTRKQIDLYNQDCCPGGKDTDQWRAKALQEIDPDWPFHLSCLPAYSYYHGMQPFVVAFHYVDIREKIGA